MNSLSAASETVIRDSVETSWTDAAYPRDSCIHTLFETQVELSPRAVAIETGTRRLTYEELNSAANRLAHSLRECGVGPETMVGICLPRSLALIVGVLGILKAGGAYVALDPGDPSAQSALMIEDAQLSVIVTEESLRDLTRTEHNRQICLDPDGAVCAPTRIAPAPSLKDRNIDSGATSTNLAYVSFTSGSTGQPKGVCIPHRGVVRLVKGNWYAKLTKDQVFLQLAPIAFDASTFEIWGALLNGARLVIFPLEAPSHAALTRIISSKGVTILWLTAGLFHRLVDEGLEPFQGLRQLLVGGDVLSVPHVIKALAGLPDCELINGYGPTENTTFTCCYRICPPVSPESSIPIGRPIANTQVYVLNSNGQRVPAGETGELYAGGDGLARGYLKRPELTAQRFVPNPFEPGALLYRTGDLVRQLPDGNFEFIGRLDQQVKIRGFRVEPSGIEAVLGTHPGVREAAVIAAGTVGQKYLSAYIVLESNCTLTTGELQTFIHRKLPKYMVPTAFTSVSALPLTSSGKVDRKALAPLRPGQKLEEQRDFTPPETATEKLLNSLWCETLGIGSAGIDQDFFDLGGDSLQAVSLLSLIEQRLGKRLPLVSLIEAHTIRELAALLDQYPPIRGTRSAFVRPIKAPERVRARPPLFFVHGQVGDELTCYLHVAANLSPEQSVHGLSARDLIDGTEFGTIEEMAADHVESLRACQPKGPYFLGGHCFGGLVAFEMAQQLHTQGEKVGLLAVIDYSLNQLAPRRIPSTPQALLTFLRNVGWAAADYWEIKKERQAALSHSLVRMERFIRRLKSRLGGEQTSRILEVDDFSNPLGYTGQQLRRLDVQFKAWRCYKAQPYAGRITLFRPRRLPVFQPYDETLGWRAVAAGGIDLQIVPVPGVHGYMLRPPYAPVLARHLDRCLVNVQRGA